MNGGIEKMIARAMKNYEEGRRSEITKLEAKIISDFIYLLNERIDDIEENGVITDPRGRVSYEECPEGYDPEVMDEVNVKLIEEIFSKHGFVVEFGTSVIEGRSHYRYNLIDRKIIKGGI